VTLALGGKIGRMPAHQLVERACHLASATGQELREVLAQDPQIGSELPAAELDRLFDPAGYTGEAQAFVDRVLQTYHCRKADHPDQE
jgi:3-carboxy-cis,cis-muconate cycloisomerase